MNVLDNKKLRELGFDGRKYYCGNASSQKLYTKLANILKSIGVRLIFNRACFIHDYNQGKMSNFKADFIFLKDMLKLLIAKAKKDKRIMLNVPRYAFVMIFYYIIVTIRSIILRK